jgi:hypothetical protein
MSRAPICFVDGRSKFRPHNHGRMADAAWATPLLASIADTSGIVPANKAQFFELRFGYALHGGGVTPQYGIAGEGGSFIAEFGLECACIFSVHIGPSLRPTIALAIVRRGA